MGRTKPVDSLISANEKGRLSFAARPELSLKSGSTKWPPDPKLAAISSDHRGQRSLAAANGGLYSVEAISSTIRVRACRSPRRMCGA